MREPRDPSGAAPPVRVTVSRVRTVADLACFFEIESEYEQSLPHNLRHFLPASAELAAAYAEPNAAFIGWLDDAAGGAGAFTRLDAQTGLMKRLFVRPYGRRQGLARALISTTVQHARSLHQQRLVLDTDRVQLPAAYDLYIALGFTECPPFGPVTYANATFLELRL